MTHKGIIWDNEDLYRNGKWRLPMIGPNFGHEKVGKGHLKPLKPLTNYEKLRFEARPRSSRGASRSFSTAWIAACTGSAWVSWHRISIEYCAENSLSRYRYKFWIFLAHDTTRTEHLSLPWDVIRIVSLVKPFDPDSSTAMSTPRSAPRPCCLQR